MKQKIFLSILLLVLISTLVHSAEQKEYLSPDGKYRAYVIPLPNVLGSRECQITIEVTKGKTLCSKSYGSEDGEHGFGVEKAAWTPDSKFFVYSISSSGGHQSWHFPTDFIAITDCKIRNLDDYFGPVTDPSFVLSAPDSIKTVGRDKSTLDEADFKVRLSKLVIREKKE
jgi:dipeptidyl aminopeptidase/acylaminoacyl peptidase